MSRRAALAFVLAAAAACTSPESARTQGGGPGADIGNRGEVVLMHEGSRPFADTPRLAPAKGPDLTSALHADRLSRDQQ